MCVAMSDPLATYPVAVPETGATILITPCPGKRQRDLGRDLDQAKSAGAEAVLTLFQVLRRARGQGHGETSDESLHGTCQSCDATRPMPVCLSVCLSIGIGRVVSQD